MAKWNVDVPTSEYYGPLPLEPRGIFSGDLHQLIRELEATTEIAVDTETTGLIIFKEQVLYWSLAWGNRRCTLHACMLPYFLHIFADRRKTWIFANAKYDMHMLGNMGVIIAGTIHCTQVMHSLLFEEQSHKLKDMAKHLLGWRWSDFQDTFGKITVNFPPLELIQKAERENFPLLVEYAANDAWGTLGVYRDLRVRLQQAITHSLFRQCPPFIETLWDLFTKVEAPYTKVLWKNERNGVLIDVEYLKKIGPIALDEIQRLEQNIVNYAGWMLRVSAPADLGYYFFTQRGYKPLKMTSGGQSGVRKPSVDADFIKHVAEEYQDPLANMVLEHRNLTKLHGTYILGIEEWLDNRGRIHTRFNQDITRTGRLSSVDPNLQNIPNVEKDKWRLRAAFIASVGHELLVHDYNQLEMRLLAAASREKDMIDIFLRNWDIHMGNASMMMGIPYEELKEAKSIDKKVKEGSLAALMLTDRVMQCLAARAAAKNIGFGLNYGMGAGKLANDLGISRIEAEAKIAQYKKTYPAVTSFYQECVATTRQTGYAFTILGRRRNLPGIASSRNDERARAERQCINLEIQGTAADVVKMAQINLDKAELDRRYGCISLLNIHDELIHECPTETADFAQKEITEWMEQPFFLDLDVPLTVATGRAKNWQDAK
jgi:DNA polymerase-1